jgi:hypothetical protein
MLLDVKLSPPGCAHLCGYRCRRYSAGFFMVRCCSARLTREGSITLLLTDIIGRRLRVLHDGLLAAGESRINAVLGNLPSGVYRLLLTSPSGVEGRSVVVLR